MRGWRQGCSSHCPEPSSEQEEHEAETSLWETVLPFPWPWVFPLPLGDFSALISLYGGNRPPLRAGLRYELSPVGGARWSNLCVSSSNTAERPNRTVLGADWLGVG